MSKVVFVGNVPYTMTEDELINVFKSVGQVVGFRLVFDRETGKPRGYGFCEFADHETAASAVRNLNNTDVGGRPLRIDLADSDPFLEGKTTVHGEIIDGGETRAEWKEREKRERGHNDGPAPIPRNPPSGAPRNDIGSNGFLKSLPAGIPLPPGTTSLDAISHTLASINPVQLTEVLAQMKAFVINHPDQARILLVTHPQLSYALFQALLLNKIVDPAILQRMLAATHGAAPGGSEPPMQLPPQGVMPPTMPVMNQTPTIPQQYPQYQQPMQQQPPFYRPPPQQAPVAAPPPVSTPQIPQAPTPQISQAPTPQMPQAPTLPPNIDPSQREMLMQVLALSPEQINNLPPNEREAIQQLKSQFMGVLGVGS